MVFLPEACDYICSTSLLTIQNAESLGGEFITNYRNLASELKIWISLGSFHRKEETNGNMFNTHVLIDDNGEIKCSNDKIHLFEINHKSGDSITTLKESEYTQPGSEFYMPVETPVGLMSPSIVCLRNMNSFILHFFFDNLILI